MLPVNPFVQFILALLGLYRFGLIISIIMSFLISFEILNKYNPIVNKVMYALDRLYEPVLSKIRNYIPNLGSIDISPIILFLSIDLVRNLIISYL